MASGEETTSGLTVTSVQETATDNNIESMEIQEGVSKMEASSATVVVARRVEMEESQPQALSADSEHETAADSSRPMEFGTKNQFGIVPSANIPPEQEAIKVDAVIENPSSDLEGSREQQAIEDTRDIGSLDSRPDPVYAELEPPLVRSPDPYGLETIEEEEGEDLEPPPVSTPEVVGLEPLQDEKLELQPVPAPEAGGLDNLEDDELGPKPHEYDQVAYGNERPYENLQHDNDPTYENVLHDNERLYRNEPHYNEQNNLPSFENPMYEEILVPGPAPEAGGQEPLEEHEPPPVQAPAAGVAGATFHSGDGGVPGCVLLLDGWARAHGDPPPSPERSIDEEYQLIPPPHPVTYAGFEKPIIKLASELFCVGTFINGELPDTDTDLPHNRHARRIPTHQRWMLAGRYLDPATMNAELVDNEDDGTYRVCYWNYCTGTVAITTGFSSIDETSLHMAVCYRSGDLFYVHFKGIARRDDDSTTKLHLILALRRSQIGSAREQYQRLKVERVRVLQDNTAEARSGWGCCPIL
eukprot:scpid58995/ scgid16396/ 